MGGSSVPSNTTQTTLLDPVRQKGLQDASKYFNKWAATYNGPTYKGPLVAGRTQDWYTAQDMAHKMANRFSKGGITSVRRFEDGGGTTAQPWWSGYNDAQDAQDAGVTQPVDNTYVPSSQANLEASAQNAGYQGDLSNTGAMQSYLDSQNAGYQDYTGNYAKQQAIDIAAAQQQAQQAIDKAAAQQWAQQAVNYTYAPSSQQQLEDQAQNAGYQGYLGDTAAMQGYLNANPPAVDTVNTGTLQPQQNQNLGTTTPFSYTPEATTQPLSLTTLPDTVNTGLASLKDTLSGGAAKDTLSGGAGVDTTLGGAAKDTLSGGAGVDTTLGGAGVDTTLGGAAKDSISGGITKDTITTPVYTAPTYKPTPTTTNTQSPYLIAQGLAQKGVNGIYGITDKNLTPQQLSNTYTNPDQITPGTITPDMWNATAMDTYMSPYTKGVVDIALREAYRQRAIERLRENTAATQSGAFGGYRQGVVEAEGERNYNQRLGDIVNTGYQNAYNNAQTQFNADRASSVGAQTTNQANALQAYQNNQAALQQEAILGAQVGQNNINNARQSVQDQLNALNMAISGASQLPAIETAYQQGSGIAQNALTTADASARSAMQAYYDAIAKLSDANGNINLQKAQNLSNIMFGNNIPSGVQATVKT